MESLCAPHHITGNECLKKSSLWTKWIDKLIFLVPFNSSGVTPTAVESEDNVSSLNFTVLNSEAAKRISSTSSSISDHDQDKDSYEEQTKLIRKQANNTPNESTYDFRYIFWSFEFVNVNVLVRFVLTHRHYSSIFP